MVKLFSSILKQYDTIQDVIFGESHGGSRYSARQIAINDPGRCFGRHSVQHKYRYPVSWQQSGWLGVRPDPGIRLDPAGDRGQQRRTPAAARH